MYVFVRVVYGFFTLTQYAGIRFFGIRVFRFREDVYLFPFFSLLLWMVEEDKMYYTIQNLVCIFAHRLRESCKKYVVNRIRILA